MILAILVAAAGASFCYTQVTANLRERDVILNGIPVTAKVTNVENNFVRGKKERNTRGLAVALTYQLPGAEQEERDVPGRLPPNIPEQVAIDDELPVRISRTDPRIWTGKKEAETIASSLLVGLALAPIALLLVVAMVLARRRIISIWRDGVDADAVVVDSHQSSIAPLSRVVRFALTDGPDQRVFSTLCPTRHAPQKGEHVVVLHARNNPGRAVLADLYL